MIEKNNENQSKNESSKLHKEDEIEMPSNFKLLYRNTTNPERDKSSGVSSDEDTSSSLAPIPDTLKQLRNKSKWTVSDARENSEVESAYNDGGDLGKSSGNMMSSFEELRKKYALKNESSVVLKVNSANKMLDDILNSANLNKTFLDNNKFVKKDVRLETESETSTTETTTSHPKPCPHIIDHCHLPLPLDFYSFPCFRHCTAAQHLNTSEDKIEETNDQDKSLQDQRNKSLKEKLQDLHIGLKIQSAYRAFQKTRSPSTKIRKDFENTNSNCPLKIPEVSCQGDGLTQPHSMTCKCKQHKQLHHQQMNLDLVESSEMSQSETRCTEREDCHWTYLNQRNCNCPEVIPQCFCVQHIQVQESPKQNSSVANYPVPENNETDPSFLTQNPEKDEDDKKSKPNPKPKKITGWKHHKEKNVIERTDIYYFDHGNSEYYQTTDNHPVRYTECLVERTDECATKFWAEFFGTVEIGVAFIISFFLQLYRFLFTSIIRSLTVGLLQIFSDYFFKPLLTVLFNGIIQPCLILMYNVATSVRDLCLPISEIFGFFAKEVANILRSCRLVDISRDKQASCNCGNKV